jgi:diguanylate cyclase (GGDEF)-like protein
VIITLVSAILASIVVGFVAKFYLVEKTVEDVTKKHSTKISQLAFELIYAGMEHGWKRDEFEKLASKLSIIEPGLKIKFYKNEKLVQMFGESSEDKAAKQNDKLIQEAMLNKNSSYNKTTNNSIRYLYPLSANKECLKCHTNVKEGYINGVVDIEYWANDTRETLSTTLSYLVLFLISFLIIVFTLFYLSLNKFFITPIKKLSNNIRDVMLSNSLDQYVEVGSKIVEISKLEYHLNKLINNLSEHAKIQERLLSTDTLTGLPNRLKLKEDILTYKNPLVILLNIDAFKEINDLYGVKIGDFILIEFANTVKTTFIAKETIYRFAGDEYCILMELGEQSNVDVEIYVQNLLKIIKKCVFPYNDYEITVDMTVGAASGSESILERADIALKSAKKQKKDFVIFSENIQIKKQYENNIRWTGVLKGAIDSGRIRAYYQPIINNITGDVEKYETLVRLIQDDGRVISPGLFLDVAKKTKIYPQLTKIVIKNAFRAFSFTNYQFSINISVEDALNEEVRELIFSQLASFPKPKNVIFEITEGEGIEINEEISYFLNKIKALGALIAIDDFGTGYSNFAYILELSVDIIKLDGSLIRNIDTDKNSELIVKTIVSFCKEMNIKTVAEFVHSKAVFEKVKSLGIEYSQGYYFSEPLDHV